MTWRDEFVAKILLLVARMFCDDPALAQDIKNLSNAVGAAKYDKRDGPGVS